MPIQYKGLDRATLKKFKNVLAGKVSDDYWKKRGGIADRTEAEVLKNLLEVYRDTEKAIEAEVYAFYGKYAEENGLTLADVHKRLDKAQLKSMKEELARYYSFADPAKMRPDMSKAYRDELRLLSARAYMSRLEEIKAKIKFHIIKLAAKEDGELGKALVKAYKEAYGEASYESDKARGFSDGYVAPDNKVVENLVKKPWNGESFSDRVWNDKGKLLSALDRDFLSGVAQGHNPKKIALEMARKNGLKYKSCERLVRTEMLHAMGEARSDSFAEHGIEKYQFVSDLSEKTCPVCGGLDGEVFELKYKEVGVNFPPIHPNCGCTTIPFFDDEASKLFGDGERVAYMDGHKIYEVPADMTYEEWAETRTP